MVLFLFDPLLHFQDIWWRYTRISSAQAACDTKPSNTARTTQLLFATINGLKKTTSINCSKSADVVRSETSMYFITVYPISMANCNYLHYLAMSCVGSCQNILHGGATSNRRPKPRPHFLFHITRHRARLVANSINSNIGCLCFTFCLGISLLFCFS